ncbi:MAG: iron-sulfur cluster-binding protein [Chloroflexi bacterium]|nr:iron-sulfur cluster-binding protein [Chloroflexota bacterium]
MTQTMTRINFRTNTQHVSPEMISGVQAATTRFLANRGKLVAELGNWEALRQSASDIRLHTINHLDYYLEQLERNVIAAGGHVHWARDAAQAHKIFLRIAHEHNVKTIVKSKSMASEEIHLNDAMEAAGIHALETDLGEYIIQLAGTGPSHIIVPALHLRKEGIAELFHEKLGVDAPPDPVRLTQIAHEKLRQEFLSAEMGMSGANFMVAETGTIVVVTNEGNGRMVTTQPPVHVAIVGIDKVIPDWESLTVFLKLLARSATGQKISTYTSFITGPRRTEGENGPQEFHLVLLDNGRTKILRDEKTRETLKCIRCGACLNICPVYNNVGGHAYGFAYSGPIGAILSPQLLGTQVAADLPYASTLCGACADICPVKIPIPEILLHLRHRVAEGDAIANAVVPSAMRAMVTASTLSIGMPWLYRFGSQLLKIVEAPFRQDGWLRNLPPPLNRWTSVRPLPAFKAQFRAWWRKRK